MIVAKKVNLKRSIEHAFFIITMSQILEMLYILHYSKSLKRIKTFIYVLEITIAAQMKKNVKKLNIFSLIFDL